MQNTTSELVNYELCLKMREVKIQAQFVGTRLCWINHVWAPSQALATSELLHIAPNADYAALVGDKPPAFHPTAPPSGSAVYEWLMGIEDDNEFTITQEQVLDLDDLLPAGAQIVGKIFLNSEGDEENGKVAFKVEPGGRKVRVTRTSTDDGYGTWFVNVQYAADPKVVAADAQRLEDYNDALKSYNERLLDAQYRAFVAARERVKLCSTVTTRPTATLRQEERICVMRRMMEDPAIAIDDEPGAHRDPRADLRLRRNLLLRGA